jgi:hypothetical protein
MNITQEKMEELIGAALNAEIGTNAGWVFDYIQSPEAGDKEAWAAIGGYINAYSHSEWPRHVIEIALKAALSRL